MTNTNKELGMLLGLHVGDSLGATLEFKRPSPRWDSHKEITGGGVFHWNAGQATDDTDLMLCVLKSIQNKKTFNVIQLKNRLINWKSFGPKDIGNTISDGIYNLELGRPLGMIAHTSESNGSLMRVCPISLMDLDNNELKEVLKLQANCTHLHNNVLLADELFILCLKQLINGSSKNEVREFALNWSANNFPLFNQRLVNLKNIDWFNLKTSGYVVDTLLSAFWALDMSSSFEEAVVLIANRGDDADTCGAVAGAFCGAFYGKDNIPIRWLNVIQYHDEIIKSYNKIT